MPANKEIPKVFKINLGYGEPYEITVELNWRPQRCTLGEIYGHTTMSCPKFSKISNSSAPHRHEWRTKVVQDKSSQEVLETRTEITK